MKQTASQQLRKVSLEDKYTLEQSRAYMTGVEALVRLPMLQHQRDAARGLNTAGFVSGYRGSPLGGVDQAMWQAEHYLKHHQIHFNRVLTRTLLPPQSGAANKPICSQVHVTTACLDFGTAKDLALIAVWMS
jgi:hypothetical protein